MKNGLITDEFENKYWYKNNNFHREDGPAIEYINGAKYWYKEGSLHREYGPAIEYINGSKYWYLNGKYINCSTQEEFNKLIKLRIFW